MRDSGSDAEALIPTYDPTFYDYTALCTTEKHLTQRSRLPLPRRIIFPSVRLTSNGTLLVTMPSHLLSSSSE